MTKSLQALVNVAACAALVLTLTGCGAVKRLLPFGSFNVNRFTGDFYDHAEQYLPGDQDYPAEGVTEIDLCWLSGLVKVETWSGSTIRIRETGITLTEDLQVHSLLEGDTLHIRFAASGATGTLTNGMKMLTLQLPAELELSSFAVSSTSAECSFTGFRTQSFAYAGTSGDLLVELDAQSYDIGTTSGSVRLIADAASRICLSSTSGSFRAELGRVQWLDHGSTSGGLHVTAQSVANLNSCSTSGKLSVSLQEAPKTCDLGTTSGGVSLTLPADCGFTAHVSTNSGSFHCQFPTLSQGKSYLCGDGSSTLDLTSTSGSIDICKG